MSSAAALPILLFEIFNSTSDETQFNALPILTALDVPNLFPLRHKLCSLILLDTAAAIASPASQPILLFEILNSVRDVLCKNLIIFDNCITLSCILNISNLVL